MRKLITSAFLLASLGLITVPSFSRDARADGVTVPVEKEWTMLVFLNGHNNLDSFGAMNINQMEQYGSTKDLNVVVQWASSASRSTKRLLVQKDYDTRKVNSPVIEDMGEVDMGDWQSVVEFVRWGVQHYPAKHYFIDMWDHGSGWHAIQMHNQILAQGGMGVGRFGSLANSFTPLDISWDDESGNHITTAQLGQAITESAKIIGHKVDVLASDACLMAMAEIAAEMSDSVDIYAGSEEVEPGAGWPYQMVMKRWHAQPHATPAEVATFLGDEYLKSYTGGVNGKSEVTFSAFDVSKLPSLIQTVSDLSSKLLSLDETGRKSVLEAAKKSTNFDISDYVDLGDFLSQVSLTRAVDSNVIEAARVANDRFVISNHVSKRYANAKGAAIWIPTSSYTYKAYSKAYQALQFDQATHWSDALAAIVGGSR